MKKKLFMVIILVAMITTKAFAFSGGMGLPPDGAPGGNQPVEHGSYATKVNEDSTGVTYFSNNDTENAVRVEGDKVTLESPVISKTDGKTTSGESSSFYGVNAGLLAMDSANVTINKAKVNTSVEGGNGIFSYGEGTVVTLSDSTIRTTKNASGGVMVTGGGTMYVNNCDIETQGESSAAIRTDRGGGILTVNGGKYISNGKGSPAIYSTAKVSATDAILTSTTSEALVIEGQNSVSLKNCQVSGKMIRDNVENLHNIMIYQSMSGDAKEGKSSFKMEGGTLTSGNGDMIYVTNTSCEVNLTNVILNLFSDVLLKVVGNDARNGWGVVGKNGGQCDFTADNQILTGNIVVDKTSELNISLTNKTEYTGAINTAKQGGIIELIIDDTSEWTLTSDSYISTFNGKLENINRNGNHLYVNGVELK